MAEYLQFKRGKLAGLSTADITPGTVYITTDERAMYVDYTDGDVAKRMRLGDYVEYNTLTELEATANSALSTTAFYFVKTGNMLLRWTGDESQGHNGFIQINPDTITEIKGIELAVVGDTANNKATITTSILDSNSNNPTVSNAITIEGSDGAKVSATNNSTIKIEVSSISEDTHYTPEYDTTVDFKATDANKNILTDATTTDSVDAKRKVRFVSGINVDTNGHVVGLGYDVIADTHAGISDTELTAANNTDNTGVKITNNVVTTDNSEAINKGVLEIVGEGATAVAATNNGKITISSVDSKVTSVENHYTPVNGTALTLTDSGVDQTKEVAIDVVTAIKADAAGHITGAEYTTMKDTHAHPVSSEVIVTSGTNKADVKVKVADTDGMETTSMAGMSIAGADAATVSVSGETITISATDTKVTSADNHYTPVFAANAVAEDDGDVIANEAIDVVVSVQLDSKGHTTGVTTKTIKDTHGSVDAIALTAENQGFKSTITFDSVDTSSAILDPIVKIGTTDAEVHFVNGAADLDVYTTSEVDALITSRLKAADAMTFMGSLTATQSLPTTSVNAGDTWIVAEPGSYAGTTARVGDLFIALEDMDTSNDSNWAYVPAGNDEAPQLTGADNKIRLGYLGAEDELGAVEVKGADNCGIVADVTNNVMTIGFEWGTF